MQSVEEIRSAGQLLCLIVTGRFVPEKTTFLTSPDLKQQVGFIVYGKGKEIPRHGHRLIERQIVGTSEVIVVWKGSCELDIYNDQKALIATRMLNQGDIMVMVGGGHGFRMCEDTILLEVKQGPYPGLDEKERF